MAQRAGHTNLCSNLHSQGCRFPPASGVFSLLFVMFPLVGWGVFLLVVLFT